MRRHGTVTHLLRRFWLSLNKDGTIADKHCTSRGGVESPPLPLPPFKKKRPIQLPPRFLSGFQIFSFRTAIPNPLLGSSKNWLFQTWLFAIVTLFAPFCALLRSFADSHLRPFALICSLLRASACFCKRPRLERPRLGTPDLLAEKRPLCFRTSRCSSRRTLVPMPARDRRLAGLDKLPSLPMRATASLTETFSRNSRRQWLDDRQITHLICVRVRRLLYDFF